MSSLRYELEYLEEDYPNDFKRACHCLTPDPEKYPKYKPEDVIDEDKSVRWNREEVAKRIQAYYDEVTRLESVRQEKMNKVNDAVIEAIAFELKKRCITFNEDVAHKKATALFNYASLIRHDEREDAYYLVKLIKRLVDFAEMWETPLEKDI